LFDDVSSGLAKHLGHIMNYFADEETGAAHSAGAGQIYDSGSPTMRGQADGVDVIRSITWTKICY